MASPPAVGSGAAIRSCAFDDRPGIPAMKVYADTGFLVKLVTHEAGSEQAMAEFRRLDSPRLVFQPLHALEVSRSRSLPPDTFRRRRRVEAVVAGFPRWTSRPGTRGVSLGLAIRSPGETTPTTTG
ncbi:MAG TPA: hypothetical protein PKK57_08240, partial [Verrucomicrobiota bacterium]|nr:hypothetical protein [Verrucomicrobiota bacterium]